MSTQKYLVIKMTKIMEDDLKKCEELQIKGIDKDCCGCSMSMCVANGKVEEMES